MKTAEEILTQYFDTNLPYDENIVCYYPHLLEAMKEYAQQEIQKDRERIKSIFINTVPFGSVICKDIDSVPINLD